MTIDRFSQYFETEEDYIEWQEYEAENDKRRALHQLKKRQLKATRIARRPALFSIHEINTSVEKFRDIENSSCEWIANKITPIYGNYIGYRYKFNGEWKPELDTYYEPGDGHYFSQTKTVEVWLFLTHENRKPIMVFPFEINND